MVWPILVALMDLAQDCKHRLIRSEGFPTYGGLTGYDMEAIAVGLKEVVNENYLAYRIASVAYLGNKLTQAGVPIVQPPRGHAIYIDVAQWLPHIPPHEFPAWALSCARSLVLFCLPFVSQNRTSFSNAILSLFLCIGQTQILYLEGGIRTVEIGSVMFGTNATKELVRLAFPRRACIPNPTLTMLPKLSFTLIASRIVSEVSRLWKHRPCCHTFRRTWNQRMEH